MSNKQIVLVIDPEDKDVNSVMGPFDTDEGAQATIDLIATWSSKEWNFEVMPLRDAENMIITHARIDKERRGF